MKMVVRRRTYSLQLLILTVTSFVCVRLFTVRWTQYAEPAEAVQGEYAGYAGSKLERIAFEPFKDGYAKKVVILTYQRCGSTFFGQLFNTNPDVFYMYEPLDSLYTALYGTKDGWNVPSDITSHWDGTERELPRREIKAVATFLKHLLSCNIESLPTETLIHKYWFQFAGDHKALKGYVSCLRTNHIRQANCSGYTHVHCGNRFGEYSQERIDECNQRLWNDSYGAVQDEDSPGQRFAEYKTCMDRLRKMAIGRCGRYFREICAASRLRSAKTVRATMASMEELLEGMPNFRLIHLIRDPRAVALSRRNFDNSARGKYSMGDLAKEAKLYCRTVVNDVRTRRRLERRYPGKIFTIIYDDLVQEPLRYAESIYLFLNTSLPPATMKWIADHTGTAINSSAIAQKWQNQLSFRKANEISKQCMQFFLEVDHPWPGIS